nr:ribonuclease HII [Maliibacterium massiliense]
MRKIAMTQKEIARLEALTRTERALQQAGYALVAGMDEAGRGPLAGPVAAACVILPTDAPIAGVNDSKKVSAPRREALYEEIIAKAVAYHVALVAPARIDQINILQATRQAMCEAVQGLAVQPDYLLVDAMEHLPVAMPMRALVHGDALSYSIAAASILAKVTRDRLMVTMDAQYPQYGFAQHKGYGTAQHIAALKAYGPCPLHRRSFIGHFVQTAEGNAHG